MNRTKFKSSTPGFHKFWGQMQASRWLMLSILMLALMTSLIGSVANAQDVPPAGTMIGNQATATYTDSTGDTREVSSNVVRTEVLPVYAHTLEQDQTITAAANVLVYFPHTITNTGNGPDSYGLAVSPNTDVNNPVGNLVFYADENGDGLPDSPGNPITVTPELQPGEKFNFVLAVQSPATTAVESVVYDVTSTSSKFPADTETATDTLVLTDDASIQLNKSIDIESVKTDYAGNITYSIRYKNVGNKTATDVHIVDLLDNAFEIVPGTVGTWNGLSVQIAGASAPQHVGSNGGVRIHDVNYPDTRPSILDSTRPNGTFINMILPSLEAGQEGVLTFLVRFKPGTTINPQVIPNTALTEYGNGGGSITTGQSNTVNLNVEPIAGVVPSLDPNNPDVNEVEVVSVPEGGVAEFRNIFRNTGNAADRFLIEIKAGNTYPAGTTFKLFKDDGFTPIVDGLSDLVPAGEEFTVVLKAYLPANAASTTVPADGFRVSKTATSQSDPTKSAEITDILREITEASVTLINGDGWHGTIVPNVPHTTKAAFPGSIVRFQLIVTNTSAFADNYDLTADDLPSGWVVVFRNAAGTIITNTGNIPVNGTADITAEVHVPQGAAATDLVDNPDGHVIDFGVLSPNTGASATKPDSVIVHKVRNIVIEPNNIGQTTANNVIVYSHVIRNNGNITEEIDLSVLNSLAGKSYTSIVYRDLNENGVLDGLEDTSALENITLAPGEERYVLVKVYVPATATAGSIDVATISAIADNTTIVQDVPELAFYFNGDRPDFVEVAPNNGEATDTTTIVAGFLNIVKSQVTTDNAGGVLDTGSNYSSANGQVEPGDYIRYKITVTNSGPETITNVNVYDYTPAFTTYDGNGPTTGPGSGPASIYIAEYNIYQQPTGLDNVTTTSGFSVNAPTNQAAGPVHFLIPEIKSQETYVIYFGVRVNGLPTPASP